MVAVLRDVGDALLGPLADGQVGDVLSIEPDGAGVDLHHAVDGVGKLGLAVAGDAGHGEDLAAADLEGHVLHHVELGAVLDGEVLHLQDDVLEAALGLVGLEVHLAADHEVRHLLRGGGLHVQHVDELAAAQNGAAVGDAADLLDLMGDEDDGLAAFTKAVDDLEQEFDLLGGEDGGRLVKDQDIGLAVEHFQDLHALTDGDLDILDEVGGVHLQAVFLGKLRDLLVGLLHVHHGKEPKGAPFGLHAQDDVFCHGVVFHQLEVLVHHADRVGGGVVGGAHLHALAVDDDLAGVRLVHTKEHAHERGFACAVLAQKGIHLAALYLDGHVVIGDDAGKALGDMPHFHNIIFHVFSLFIAGRIRKPCGHRLSDTPSSSGWIGTGGVSLKYPPRARRRREGKEGLIRPRARQSPEPLPSCRGRSSGGPRR